METEDPSSNNSSLENELLDAIWNMNAARVTELLARGANIECCNDSGNTPLHLAIENLWIEGVVLLLDAGANVNARRETNGLTPLANATDIVSDAASQVNRIPDNELIRLLIQRGANVRETGPYAQTPLGILRHYDNEEAEAILREAVSKAD